MRIFLLLLTFGIANAFCLDEWFTIPVGPGGFNQVDYSGTVLTMFPSNGSNMSIPGSTSGSANTNQLNITAPNGKENVYLAMVLNAASTGSKIMVFGSRSGTLITVPSTGRLSIVY